MNNEDIIRVRKWRGRGLEATDDEIIEILKIFHSTTECNKCQITLTDKNCGTQKCMDHNHSTKKFRQILCKSCNLHHDRKKQTYTRMSEEEKKERVKIAQKKYYDSKRKDNPERKEYIKNRRLYVQSWGGDKRFYNNFLDTDADLFS